MASPHDTLPDHATDPSPDAASEASTADVWAAWLVSLYHVLIFVAVFVTAFFWFQGTSHADGSTIMSSILNFDELFVALAFGALGAALTTSRYVVLAVRHGKYDCKRILWQVLTPIHGAVLAPVGVIIVKGGLVSLATGAASQSNTLNFVIGFSFLVGLSSEVFIKRLIMAAESLFGETGRESATTIGSLEKN